MKQPNTNFWLDVVTREILAKYSDDSQEIVISSGISPSASYHIGHFREILTADAITWNVRLTGRKTRHVHVVDNFDPLRKRYDFLPPEFDKYVGWPICLVPDPFEKCRDEHQTYAEHFYQEFEKSARLMGIHPDEIVRSYEDLYKTGKMAPRIDEALEKSELIRHAFEEISNRALPEDWTPVQLLVGDRKLFVNAHLSSWHKDKQTLEGEDYTSGRAKLNWRLDWPARWAVLGVKVEPFSVQEHGAAGGSYDTGVFFSREVFKYEPPIPGVQYANIHLPGDTKKMSSSKGNLVTPAEALAIMPPEVLRYFVVRSKPERTIYFDKGEGLYNLIDEYAAVQKAWKEKREHEFMDAFQFAALAGSADMEPEVISSVPFKHLVAVYQAAQRNAGKVFELLQRTGFGEEVRLEHDVIRDELGFVGHWLEKYAPDNVKFAVQKVLPKVELSVEQREFLGKLADTIEAEQDLNGQGMHDAVYAAAEASGLKASHAFVALYRVLLGQDSGPKAGWFLASLDHDWLVMRLREGSTEQS